MIAPDLDLLGIFVPTPALAIGIVFVALFLVRRVFDNLPHDWPLSGKIWRIGTIQVCIYMIVLGGVLRLFGGPSSMPLSVVLSEWLQQFIS